MERTEIAWSVTVFDYLATPILVYVVASDSGDNVGWLGYRGDIQRPRPWLSDDQKAGSLAHASLTRIGIGIGIGTYATYIYTVLTSFHSIDRS